MDCSCPRDALCDQCLENRLAELGGTAASRGWAWAGRVAQRTPRSQPWPPHEGKAAEQAREQVADLGHDPKLLERLAVTCAKYAARRWFEIQRGLPAFSPESRHLIE